MAKHLKLKISQVITSIQSTCRSYKDLPPPQKQHFHPSILAAAATDDDAPRRKIDSDDGVDVGLDLFPPFKRRVRKIKRPKSKSRSRRRMSTSSSADDRNKWFVSSEGDDEREEEEEEEEETETLISRDALLSGLAVVKRSEDPRGDFRRSMVEMIVEKEMFEERELEELLQCFLSLNSRCHHPAIIHAFSDIWDQLFRV
ncbi:hypothetical protein QJS10_CPB19g00496 [Acorus calamus]|uniref:Transcription repressor n=1 Tax=Acorus calamus TaxID=4465 RepID=A0AAV9CHD4_ACOCL|nr:hypothetical protein QJS10_CPB19g00496 [Acorus calamus]